MLYPALLPLMRTPRLPVVNWTDARADLNGLVRFAERRNLVSERVPSRFKRSLTPPDTVAYMTESARAVHNQASTTGKLRRRLWPRFTLRDVLLTSHEFLEFLALAGTLRKFNFCAEIPLSKYSWWASTVFSQTFLLADLFWLRKTTTDTHILAHLNTECPDDG